MSRILTLYTRAGCHLCEEMLEQLQPYLETYQFSVRLVDIESDEDILRRYAIKIPVLTLDEEEICHYRLDPEILVRALNGVGGR